MYEPRYVRATVTGEAPIRDVLTRESIATGQQVVLLVRDVGTPKPPPCPRHPKKGFPTGVQPCYCGGTVIEFLQQAGAIGDVEDFDPKATAPKKGKD